MSETRIWNVQGMHCAACERRIEERLKRIPGVLESETSLKQKRSGIRYDHLSTDDLKTAFEELAASGYTFTETKDRKPGIPIQTQPCSIAKSVERPLNARIWIAIATITGVGFVIMTFTPFIRTAFPSMTAGAGIGAMIVFGVVASVSTCLATTGGYILAYTSQQPSLKRSTAVHTGRLIGFIAGGAILGSIGGSLPTSFQSFYGWFSLILGVLFLLTGLHMLELAPSLAAMGIRLPKRLSKIADRAAASKRSYAPLIVGATTFFLPCGFTQTAQTLALASGSAMRGALLMGAFAVGTLPVLVGITSVGTLATLKHHAVRLIVGAVLFCFAIRQIDGGLTLLGSHISFGSLIPKQTATATTAKNNGSVQIVVMAVQNGGYQPRNLVVKAGIPVQWEINGIDVGGCMSDIVVPSLGIHQYLKQGKNIITFTPKKTGTIPFSCGMGMVRGSFTVTE